MRKDVFRDRRAAGRALAERLPHYVDRQDVIILGLVRGGVPVGAEVAVTLHAPLDILVVRKLGLPAHPELAMGAVGPGGATVRNESVLAQGTVPAKTFDQVRAREMAEVDRLERLYRGDRPALALTGKTVILIDDGVATGASMRVAILAARQRHPARIVVAVPVAAPRTWAEFAAEVDDLVCARTPAGFFAVSEHYENFQPTSDAEVRAVLAVAAGEDQDA